MLSVVKHLFSSNSCIVDIKYQGYEGRRIAPIQAVKDGACRFFCDEFAKDISDKPLNRQSVRFLKR